MARVFMEVAVKGGGIAYIEPNMIGALIMRGTAGGTAPSESPIGLILKGYGDMLEVVGTSAHLLLAKMDRISMNNKDGLYDQVEMDGQTYKRDTVVIFMDEPDGS